MLHERDGKRVRDIGAVLFTAKQTKLEDTRKHAALGAANFDGALDIVLCNLLTNVAQQTLRITMLRSEKDQSLDHNRKTDDRKQQQQPHIPAALLHKSPKTAKHYFFDPSRFAGTYCALRQ